MCWTERLNSLDEGLITYLRIHKLSKRNLIMGNVIKMITEFVGGLGTVLLAVLPVTILWYVLTGGAVFGMDVVANLSALITSLGEGGFVGLVVLVLLTSFFVKK
tara:strand:+ start:52 stop:363 length:312 start_codon:yes stop_codon:yes gene_type:complete